MSEYLTTMRTKKWLWAALASALLIIAMSCLRMVIYPDRIIPLTYALPLLIALWHRDRFLLWSMSACFMVVSAVKVTWLIPHDYFDDYFQQFVFMALQWLNILIPAAVIHAVLDYRTRLLKANDALTKTNGELEASNEELAVREEEIVQQNEELKAQTEELEQQVQLAHWLAEQCSKAWENVRLRGELRESENRLRNLGNQIPGGAIYQYVRRSDGSEGFVYMSAGIEGLLGLSVENVLADSNSFMQRIIGEDRGCIAAAEDRSASELNVFDCEFRVQTTAGEMKWIHCRSMPRRAKDGSILWDGIIMDITKRKRVEESLANAHALLDTLLTHAPVGFVYFDKDLRYLIINDWLAKINGFSAADHIGKRIHDVVPALAPAAEEVTRQILATRQPIRDHEFVGETALMAGVKRYWNESWYPISDNAGEIVGFGAVVLETTARKHAEERTQLLSDVTASLLASDQPQQVVEALCRKVMDHLGCQVFINFLKDDEEQRLKLNACAGIPETAARHIGESNYGATVCGCVARDGSRIVTEDVQASVDPRTGHLRSHGIQAYACHPLLGQGEVIGTLSFGTRSKPAFAEDELSLMRTVADHVAIAMQRIRLVESLERQSRAAEAASEAKSQFLANMSHELRTPMNAILGMIDVALPKAIDPIVQDCLQTVKGSADLLLTLLNDLLDSAKIESGKLELELSPFSLRRMLDQITRVLSIRASEKGLCFYCRVPNETPDAVVGDRMRLQQVLLNLATNAIKFTERGEVEMSVFAAAHAEEVDLEFAVRDTGIGIPSIALERLFKPFSQADASMARRFGGTGLGLSICKSLIDMMGGQIAAESEVGKGSTFRFSVRLPLAQELPPGIEASFVIPAAARSQLRILLVEDNPANQKLATYILQDRGHIVEIAGDGHEAIYLTERNDYDVILMDVQMPGMDGLEATAAIRKRDSSRSRVPIIAMTAHAMKSDRQRCLAAGMDAYLSKPVNAQEMIGLIESLIPFAVPSREPAQAVLTLEETSEEDAAVIFDMQKALKCCYNRQKMLREMIDCFFDEMNRLFPRMRAAMDAGQLKELGILAHRLKGTLVYLGAEIATEAAKRVEMYYELDEGNLLDVQKAYGALEQTCQALKLALEEALRTVKETEP